MRIEIAVEDTLVQQAMEATGLTTKRAVVEAGLELLVRLHAQQQIRSLRGQVPWEGNLDASRWGRDPHPPAA